MWEPNDNNNSRNSNHEREEKWQVSLFQENEFKKDGIWSFQRCYIKDYIADKEGRLEKKDKEYKEIYIHFKFQESSLIPNICIYQSLYLYNLEQLQATLNHYYDQFNLFHPITGYTKYKYLRKKIEILKILQSSIDQRINKLSKYLKFTLRDDYCELTYNNLNRSILPLAIKHLQSILLIFKTWSYMDSDNDVVDRFITEISKQYSCRLPYRSFQTHYIDNLLYVQPESPAIMLKINLELTLNDTKHSLNKTLRIRNINQFKTILRFYDLYSRQDLIPLKPSLKYQDLDHHIIYRNTLQVCIDKVLKLLNQLFYFWEYDPLTLNLYYIIGIKSPCSLLIRHLELLILTFKIWNDDENDKDTMDLYLSELKDRLLPLLKDESFKSLWSYYIDSSLFKYQEYPKTLKLNLHIILKEYQWNITKTLNLKESKQFIALLDYHKYLFNSYLPSSNSFDKSLSKLLYIFEQDEDDSSILNLHYYPLSNKLDTSLIIKHLEYIVSYFNTFYSKSININTLDQYLSSITSELNSLSISKTSSSLSYISSTIIPFQYHFITQYNDRLTKSIPITNLIIDLQFLFKDFQSISNTYKLALTNIDQFLSLVYHYSLRKHSLNPSWIEKYRENKDLYQEILHRNRLQTSYDRVLYKLSERVSFKICKNSPNLSIKYIDLKGSDVPYAVKHLDTMMLVYKTWNNVQNDKFKIDQFIFLAREDVEGWFTSMMDPSTDNCLDRVVSNLSKDPEDAINKLNSKLDTLITSVDSLSLRLGTDDNNKDNKTDDDKASLISKDVSAADGRLGGASIDVPNLLEVTGKDISMMEDVD